MTLSRRPFLALALAATLAAATGCMVPGDAPDGPGYDAQIDEQITATQTLANALVERLIGLDEELAALPARATPAQRRFREEALDAASYRENRPAYEEIRAALTGLQTRIAARGGPGAPDQVATLRRLRAVLVGPGDSLQALHARAGRLPAATLEAKQGEANAVFEALLAREMALR